MTDLANLTVAALQDENRHLEMPADLALALGHDAGHRLLDVLDCVETLADPTLPAGIVGFAAGRMMRCPSLFRLNA